MKGNEFLFTSLPCHNTTMKYATQTKITVRLRNFWNFVDKRRKEMILGNVYSNARCERQTSGHRRDAAAWGVACARLQPV